MKCFKKTQSRAAGGVFTHCNVRFGSKADIGGRQLDVRFANSRHSMVRRTEAIADARLDPFIAEHELVELGMRDVIGQVQNGS